MSWGIASVAAITVLAFLVCQGVKQTPLDNKWLPVIAGGTGLVLGIVAFLVGMPDFPATDILTAAAIGVVSGFAATGTHQVYHQLTATNKDETQWDVKDKAEEEIKTDAEKGED